MTEINHPSTAPIALLDASVFGAHSARKLDESACECGPEARPSRQGLGGYASATAAEAELVFLAVPSTARDSTLFSADQPVRGDRL